MGIKILEGEKPKDLNIFLTNLIYKKGDIMSVIELRTIKITGKGQIAIPKIVRDIKGFGEGDNVILIAYKDHVEIRPLDQVSKKMETVIASEKSLAKDWNSKEDEEAWKDL